MEKLLYGVEDRPPSLITTTLLSLQHLLAALGGIIAVPLVFGGALKLPADQIVALVNAALLGSGVVTIIQCRGVGPVGIRLPCVMGTSFAFVGAGISVGLEHGVPGILGSSLVGSLVMIIGSFFMPVIRRFFPHTVTSVVVTMIGLSLTPVAVDWAAGGVGSGSYGAVGNLAIAGFVLALVIGFVQWGKGVISASAVVLGIACGYLLCLALGLIDFTQVREAPIFAIPQPLHFGMSFPVSGIVAMSIAFLVTIVETTGTFMALGAATQTPIRGKRLVSGMLCDGVGSAFAAVMSSPPVSTFAQNVGVVSLTGVVKPPCGDADRRDAAAGRTVPGAWRAGGDDSPARAWRRGSDDVRHDHSGRHPHAQQRRADASQRPDHCSLAGLWSGRDGAARSALKDASLCTRGLWFRHHRGGAGGRRPESAAAGARARCA